VSDPGSCNVRREEARRIAARILERRAAGEALPDAAVLAAHPGLRAELLEELEYAGQIRLGMAAGEKAREAGAPQPVLSWSALELPIDDAPSDDADARPDDTPARKPQVAGYVILDEIGRGGQGTVYRAIQESTDRPVAIKVIAGRPGSHYRARIEREARLLASLRHPHIVSVIERTQTATGSFCLVMEFVEGRDLDACWAGGVPADDEGTRQVLDVFIKLARAIGATHARGIVHRDLKPSNIRMDAEGEPRILDFGLARVMAPGAAARAITATGQILGSLPWASPEQASGSSIEISPASDVYSLGVMLYQALAGRFPYPVDGAFLDLLIHIARTVPPAPRFVPGARPTSPALDRVVLQALAKRPEDRYADGNALAADLEAALHPRAGGLAAPGRLRHAASITLLLGLCTSTLSTGWNGRPRNAATQTVFQLPRLTNSAGMALIRVPAGRFVMGSATGEDPQPGKLHERMVTIATPYYLGATEVTRRQYWVVMHQDPSDPRWPGPDLPVQRVTWQEANEFCRKLSALEGRRYRLPTSAEWEYACRAGATDPFGGSGSLDSVGWYAANSGGAVHPVARKQPNAWGFYDAHGNVAEWCSDVAFSTRQNALAVVRGGSALGSEATCRSAAGSAASIDARLNGVGFRVALEP
jgi:serine/threonine protein kinase